MPVECQLVLLFVAYHPGAREVEQLQRCLAALGPSMAYGVVANDYIPGEPVEQLEASARVFVREPRNLGYGRAFNRGLAALRQQGPMPAWVGALNTDLQWQPGAIETLLGWLQAHPDVAMAVPQITDGQGKPEFLCKTDPTVLAMLSRRFWPRGLKPRWLRRYDDAYVMARQDHTQVFDVPYLSGCCMLIRESALQRVGGFDECFFLYLEDADLTRRLRAIGRCVHLPVASVQHGWGRGSHRSWRLTLVTLQSAWIYFCKWGWRWW